MTKPITQDKIIQTVEKIVRHREAATKTEREVASLFMNLGFKSCRGTITNLDLEKTGLDLKFLDLHEKDPSTINKMMDSLVHKANRYNRKIAKIHQIQIKHDISSLIPAKTTIGGNIVKHLWVHDLMTFIPSDMPKLGESKIALVKTWESCVRSNELKVFRFNGGTNRWVESDIDTVLSAICFYDWARCWGKHIISGINLELASGINPDGPDSFIWFCAHTEFPPH